MMAQLAWFAALVAAGLLAYGAKLYREKHRRRRRPTIQFGIPPKKKPLFLSKETINRAWETGLVVLKAVALISVITLAAYSIVAPRAYVIDSIEVPTQTGFEHSQDFRNAVLKALDGVSNDLYLVQMPQSEAKPISIPQPLVDFKIPETGVTGQYLIERIQAVRGNAPVHISVSVRYQSRGLTASFDAEKLVIETRIDSRDIPPVNVEVTSQQALIREVVKQLLRETNPYAYGMYLLNERRMDEAVAVYNQMVADQRDLAWAYVLRASIASWTSSTFPNGDMETYARKALDLDPHFVPAYDSLGAIYGMREQKNQAVQMYEKALALDPENVITYLHYGDTLITLKDLEGAERVFQKLIDLHPEDPRGYDAMASVIARHANPDRSGLIRFLERAVVRTHNNPELMAKLGEAHHIAGDDHKAADAYDGAIKAGSRVETDYEWLLTYYDRHKELYAEYNLYQKKNFLFPPKDRGYDYGLFLLRYSKHQEALDTLLEVPLSNAPDRYDAVGRAYLGLERFNEAIPYFEQAHRLDQKNHLFQTPTAYWEVLAQAYIGAKRYTEAIGLYEKNIYRSAGAFDQIPAEYFDRYAQALRGAGRVRNAQKLEREQIRRFEESLRQSREPALPRLSPAMSR